MLNKKHNFDPLSLDQQISTPLNSNTIEDKTNELMKQRDEVSINFDKSISNSKNKFNDKFENTNHNSDIIQQLNLSVYQGNSVNNQQFSELGMINELYQNNNIDNNEFYSNIGDAFKIQNININKEKEEKNMEDRMKEYDNDTDKYLNQKTDFKKETYEQLVGISDKSFDGYIDDLIPKDK